MASDPPRAKVEKKYTWNAEIMFKSHKAWQEEIKSILADLESIKKFLGRLGESPATLLEAISGSEQIVLRASRVFVYAGFSYAVDTTNQEAAGMQSKAQGMLGEVSAATAFIRPELLQIGKSKLDEWMKQEPKLAVHKHNFEDLFRKHEHVRSGEVEELLGMLVDPLSGPSNTASMLTNADFKFEAAATRKGKKLEVTQSSIHKLLSDADRKARRTAWDNYMHRHLEFKNTLSSNLATSIKANVFSMRAHRHQSSLAASLFENNIPVEVFHNLIDTFKKHLPVWHRYFDLRRRALGVHEITYYDMWAPLAKKKIHLTYEQVVDLICDGLAPLGQEYVETIRNGCLRERWVDSAPNKGKQNGAFSWGAPGAYPFIMMSFTGDVSSLSTLAHELGHSMHSFLTWKHQPLAYSDYSLFVAEVASNFHQAMVRAYLLKTTQDTNFQIALIEEAMSNFFRYFFQMPTLARFELETHESIEKGEPLTADSMLNLMADLFSEGFGPKVKVDRPTVGMVWSTFGHLFSDYYVYQYATGISGAHALSGRILRGEKNAVEDYLGFLKAGSSGYPLNVLKKAGVDLTSSKPVEETFAVMEGYLDRLEKLLQ
jgi:oligoendopeptidase F